MNRQVIESYWPHFLLIIALIIIGLIAWTTPYKEVVPAANHEHDGEIQAWK